MLEKGDDRGLNAFRRLVEEGGMWAGGLFVFYKGANHGHSSDVTFGVGKRDLQPSNEEDDENRSEETAKQTTDDCTDVDTSPTP